MVKNNDDPHSRSGKQLISYPIIVDSVLLRIPKRAEVYAPVVKHALPVDITIPVVIVPVIIYNGRETINQPQRIIHGHR